MRAVCRFLAEMGLDEEARSDARRNEYGRGLRLPIAKWCDVRMQGESDAVSTNAKG